eukprot:m.123132 g.123132  ORF g.123132 m.123132 type:complete len:111 (+) comp15562_c0_seq4:236-568(+)
MLYLLLLYPPLVRHPLLILYRLLILYLLILYLLILEDGGLFHRLNISSHCFTNTQPVGGVWSRLSFQVLQTLTIELLLQIQTDQVKDTEPCLVYSEASEASAWRSSSLWD